MRVTIRPYRHGDDRAILEVHRAAVRGLAAGDYPSDLLEEWSPPVTDERVARAEATRETSRERLLLAVASAEVIGFGGFDVDTGEVTAVYVKPDAAGQGLGAALLDAIESRATEDGFVELWLESSLNAAGFYEARGYRREGDGEHRMGSGRMMPCVRMRKAL